MGGKPGSEEELVMPRKQNTEPLHNFSSTIRPRETTEIVLEVVDEKGVSELAESIHSDSDGPTSSV